MPFAPTPSVSAARCHGLIASPSAAAGGAVSASKRAIAAAIAIPSSALGLVLTQEAYRRSARRPPTGADAGGRIGRVFG